MKLRAFTAGLALLASGTVIGVGAQQFASADVSSGDRPVLVPIESCRLVDTRPAFNVGPRTAPLGPAETESFNTQQAGTECTGSIPPSASAIAANVTAPDSTGESFVTLWASGALPNGSTLNPQAGQLVFNAATVDLAADNSFLVYNNANNVHIIIDVIGYYENHNHDDRYARIPTVIRMTSGSDGYTVEQGIDPELTFTSLSPGVTRVGTAESSARVVMERATCTSGFSDPEFYVVKTLDPSASFAPELHFVQPDGTPLPFNGRPVFCTIWSS